MKLILVSLCLIFSITRGFLFDREVCFDDLGCFNTQTVRSLSRPIVLLPDDPKVIATRFFLYTRTRPTKDKEEELNWKDLNSLATSNYNASVPTKIIVHGFTHSAHVQWVIDMTTELLKNAPLNVITVDWRNGATFPYTQATANTRVVGAEIAKLVEFLMSQAGLKAADVHMIGHSLGAHASSEAGTKIKGIGRITGLDPAEPYFEGAVEVVRLEPRDADFVDVIHSDGSAFLGSLGMGYRASIGHVDFYPNGGGDQPGCESGAGSKLLASATSGVIDGTQALKGTFACSHEKAIHYFTESINGVCPFTAYPCKSFTDFQAGKCLRCDGGQCSVMGYHADKYPARGNFYLMTDQSGGTPYCNYHYAVNIETGLVDKNAYGHLIVSMSSSNNISLGPVPMTDKPVDIAAQSKFNRLITSRKLLKDISSVKVTYKKDDCFSCFLYTDFYRLAGVTVISDHGTQRTLLCGNNVSIAKDQFRSVQPTTGQRC